MEHLDKDNSRDCNRTYDELLQEIMDQARSEEKADQTPSHAAPVKRRRKEKENSFENTALSYLHDIVYLLAGVIVVFLLCFRVVVVSGSSMHDTLMNGDYLLLLGNLFYTQPEQGDVIVASKESFDDGKPIVKRIIATEGQWVDIDFEAGIVYVGDTADDLKPLEEPYTYTPTNLFEGTVFPLQVEQGHLFVMGDNRNNSKDSRNPEIGQIDEREILGKVIFLFLPGKEGDRGIDFGRFGVVS